jgi:uncharacterized protein (TIGR02246 family)
MKAIQILAASVIVSALGLHHAAAQATTEDRAVDEKAIRNVLAAYVETWNRHDMKSWGKLFTDDAQYVNRAGGWWRSNKENVEGHRSIHEMLVRQKQKMTYRSDVGAISFLKPDIALVHATWEWPGFVGPSGEEVRDFKGIITMVMVKRDGQWLIRALHNTVAQSPPTPEPAALEVGSSTPDLQAVRHISVSINRPPDQVYEFVTNPQNLPKWATGLGTSIRNIDGEWVADAPMGRIKIRFTPRNTLGVADHDVILESGVKIHNAMRVLPNGGGSEVIFTLLRQPGVCDEKFAEDARWVEKDLKILKELLEM